MILALAMALLAADERPEAWRAYELTLDAGSLEIAKRSDGVLFPPDAYAAVMGMIAKCETFAGLTEIQLNVLWDLHQARLAEAGANGALAAERSLAELRAESDARWPTWQTALLATGVAIVALVVGGVLTLGYQAVTP